jgi:hypothetical protein
MSSAELLRRIRNDLPMAVTIAALGRDGPPSKFRGGRFVFLCPHCGELLAAVNPRNNLAHCFACHRNLNNIDLLRQLGHDFIAAVRLLEQWLNHYQAQGHQNTFAMRSPRPVGHHIAAVSPTASEHRSGSLLQNSPQFGKPLTITPEFIRSEFGNECDHNSARNNSATNTTTIWTGTPNGQF